MNPMIVQYGETSRSNKDKHSSRRNSKGATFNATKAVARKSILMQTTKVRAANSFH
jgi:hypothetical protein